MASLSSFAHPLKAPRWLLAIILALIAANLIEVIGILALTSSYAALQVPFSTAVRVTIAGGWDIVLTVLLVNLLRHNRRAVAWAAPILTLYSLTGLVWFIVFARSDYDRGRIGFQIVLAVVTLIPIWLSNRIKQP